MAEPFRRDEKQGKMDRELRLSNVNIYFIERQEMVKNRAVTKPHSDIAHGKEPIQLVDVKDA